MVLGKSILALLTAQNRLLEGIFPCCHFLYINLYYYYRFGIKGAYQGIGATFLRDVPSNANYFVFYGIFILINLLSKALPLAI
jgi:hypothetical protein